MVSAQERSLPLNQARLLPCFQRNGRGPHFTTILRWVREGIHGVKLQAHRVGDTICTTEAAAVEFINGVTKAMEEVAVA